MFRTITSADWQRSFASARQHSNPLVSAIHTRVAEMKLRDALSPEHPANQPGWENAAQIPGSLRDQLANTIRYFHIAEPNGVSLVAARSARQAQALYFDHVKDTVWGSPDNPEPYMITQIHAREATLEDMAGFRALRVVPAKRPLKPCVLDEPIRAGSRTIAPARKTAASPRIAI